MQSTNWIFTLNNPTSDDLPRAWPDVRYCIYQVEVGDSGTRHLQGYVIINKKKTLGGMKRLDRNAHWEMRKGTHEQAKAYCSKETTRLAGPYEIGRDLEQGRRMDLEGCARAIAEGATPQAVAEQSPAVYTRYSRGLTALALILAKPRKFKTKVTVIYGETGTGKSKWALENYPDAYWKPSCSKWWDGYSDQETVVMDEFYGWLPYCEMLRLLDRYPTMVETKGGHANFVPKNIIILSNKAPEDWYEPSKCPYPALERRIENLGLMIDGNIAWMKKEEETE